jgi:hypothetical protein
MIIHILRLCLFQRHMDVYIFFKHTTRKDMTPAPDVMVCGAFALCVCLCVLSVCVCLVFSNLSLILCAVFVYCG